MRRPGLGDGNRYTQRRRVSPGEETPSGSSTAESGHWPRKWGGSGSGVGGSSEEKQIIHGDVQVRRESGAGHLDATGITSFPVDKKTRPHKAACTVDAEMSISVLLQLRMRIAVGKMKLSFEVPRFSCTYKENLRFIRLMRTF